MPMSLKEYRPILENKEKALREKLMTYADSRPAYKHDVIINSNSALPNKSITSQLCRNIRDLLEKNIPVFNDPKNEPSVFLTDSWQIRRLECEYLRLLLLQATFACLDNDLLVELSFINSSSPYARWWFGDGLQHDFQQQLLAHQNDYHKGVMPAGAVGAPARRQSVGTIAKQGEILAAANKYEQLIQLSIEPARIEDVLVEAVEGKEDLDPALDLKIELSKAVRRDSPDKIAKDLALAFSKRVAAIEEKAAVDCLTFVKERRLQERNARQTLIMLAKEVEKLKEDKALKDKEIAQIKQFMSGRPIGPAVPLCYPPGSKMQLSIQTPGGDIHPNSMYAQSPLKKQEKQKLLDDDNSSTASEEESFTPLTTQTKS